MIKINLNAAAKGERMAVLVNVPTDGPATLATTPKAADAILVYGTVGKDGLFTKVGTFTGTAYGVDYATLVAWADPSNESALPVHYVVKCAHTHDTAVSGMPEGITWTYGLARKSGRECHVCTPKATKHGCLGADPARLANSWGKGSEAMQGSCADRHAAWDAASKARAKEAREAAAKAKTDAAAKAAARVTQAAKPGRGKSAAA